MTLDELKTIRQMRYLKLYRVDKGVLMCSATMSEQLLEHYARHQRLPELDRVRAGYRPQHSEAQQAALTETVRQHAVADYDRLLAGQPGGGRSHAAEVCHD